MKVLIIDDDEVNNFLCKKVMELCDFSKDIHTCGSAQSGMEYLKHLKDNNSEEYPNLLFLDINMPVKTGWDFLEMYKDWVKDISADSLKIYMLSSSVYEDDINRAEQHPLVTQYIAKPLSETILKELK